MMTIVTTTVSVDFRYLMRRTKERLIGLYEQLTRTRLSTEQYNEMRALSKYALASKVWDVWTALPEDA